MRVVVLGAGSAGSVVAARLSERSDLEVTLVEAGPDYEHVTDLPDELRDGRKNALRDHDWGYRFRPVRGRRTFSLPRGRVVGGSSAINTAIALRGSPYDYDEWAARGLYEWSWQKCLPAFKRLEHDVDFQNDWHGRGGPLPIRRHSARELVRWQAGFVAAARAVGYAETVDHNHPELPAGVGPHAMNKIGGERISVARAYLTSEVRRRQNLRIRSGAHVDRLHFEGKRFVGVTLIEDGRARRFEADAAVVCGGAIGSPGILLRSGIGPKSELSRLGIEQLVDSPTVGARFLDHPGTALLLAPRYSELASRDQPVLQTLLRYTSRGSNYNADMQLQPGSWLPLFGLELPVVALMCALGKPEGSGTLRFTSKDPFAKPHVEACFLESDADRARLLEGLERLWQLVREKPLADLATPLYPARGVLCAPDKLRAIQPKITGSGYHASGTVPMSAERIEEGAVDGELRLRGVDNVYVADASVMPTIPSANTNLPTIMIAERFAELFAG